MTRFDMFDFDSLDGFKILDDSLGKHAVSRNLAVTLFHDEPGRIVHRRAIKPFAPGNNKRGALVCELNGVKLFIKGQKLFLTAKNLAV